MSPPADQQQRDLMRLLNAICTTSAAIAGQSDSARVAVLLRQRAACYRTIATHHPNDSEYPCELAQGAAALDEARAEKITRKTSQ